MRVLYIGDIFSTPGLRAAKAFLKRFGEDYDFVIANGENVAGGFGITRKHLHELLEAGVDVVTLGNHTWDAKDAFELLEETPRLIRPLNYPPGAPGLGYTTLEARTGERVTVVQVMGRIFLPALDCPFRALDALLTELPEASTVIVDLHAEATSEKRALGEFLAGRVAAALGTHTHVQTADELIKRGTAYLTDVGMTGVQDSAIGMRFDEVIYRFVTGLPKRYKPAEGPATVCAVALELAGGRAKSVARIQWAEPDGAA
ncbi:TIGR00282 family metallophosphoesterase [Truepera radiovictrix]|uniref:Metallophosphoesterase n=1 Tax=Truepera radiovictrix (strain DSM 17093 / CIP 108686 / LMG 22925 / RQ-24) TaxID=649638 RepID=D7CT31_TRURR|nr:TIGR00282 family metallophosphoesterase [Truepera radiovictrix]ADI15494.1 metallophosphoesterase [Truepera radiovictrix DSM 17093]WMT55955.1 TIGR00282 family metallophosphoesterase [Truepera radiovictrix]